MKKPSLLINSNENKNDLSQKVLKCLSEIILRKLEAYEIEELIKILENKDDEIKL